MKRMIIFVVITVCLFLIDSMCLAHFGMIIPSDSMVMQGEKRDITLTLSFSHPFDGTGMKMEKPSKCEVIVNGKKTDLRPILEETAVMGEKAWRVNYKVNRPGVYRFYMEPVPYWEPAEDCFIVHYTKTIVAAFGDEVGWDKPIGIKTEIVPLTRPFALYAGNVFQGMVLVDNKPVPGAEVEIEYYSREGKTEAHNDYFVTQVVKADNNGVFTYAVPKAGWWGFAGLSTSDKKMKYKGEDKAVEIGAVLWVEFHEWREK